MTKVVFDGRTTLKNCLTASCGQLGRPLFVLLLIVGTSHPQTAPYAPAIAQSTSSSTSNNNPTKQVEELQTLLNQRRFDEATKAVMQITKKQLAEFDTSQQYAVLLIRSTCFELNGKYQLALDDLTRANKLSPGRTTELSIYRLRYKIAHNGKSPDPTPSSFSTPAARQLSRENGITLITAFPHEALKWFIPLEAHEKEIPDYFYRMYQCRAHTGNAEEALRAARRFLTLTKQRGQGAAVRTAVDELTTICSIDTCKSLLQQLCAPGGTKSSILSKLKKEPSSTSEDFQQFVINAAEAGSISDKLAIQILEWSGKPLSPQNVARWKMQGYRRAGNLAAASREADALAQLSPRLDNLVDAAALHLELRQQASADRFFAAIAKLKTVSEEEKYKFFRFSARCAQDLGEFMAAEGLFKQAYDYCPPGDVRVRASIRREQYLAAIKAGKDVSQENIDLAEEEGALVEAMFYELKDADGGNPFTRMHLVAGKMKPFIERRIKRLSAKISGPSGENRNRWLLDRAELFLFLGQTQDCIRDLEQVRPDSARKERWFGIKLSTVKKDKERLELLQKMLGLGPEADS